MLAYIQRIFLSPVSSIREGGEILKSEILISDYCYCSQVYSNLYSFFKLFLCILKISYQTTVLDFVVHEVRLGLRVSFLYSLKKHDFTNRINIL